MNQKFALPPISAASDLPVIDMPPRTDHVELEHGQARPDPYRWMHNLDDPQFQQLIKQAQAHEQAFLRPIENLRQKLLNRMLSLTNENHKEVPWKEGAFRYFGKREAGQQHPKFYRFPVGDPNTVTLMLDVNALATGKNYCDVSHYSPSPDGKTMVYLIDEDGSQANSITLAEVSEENTPVLKDAQLACLASAETGKPIKTFSDVLWTPDSKGFYYTPLNERQNPDRVMYYDLQRRENQLVYLESDAERWVDIDETEDKKTLLICASTADSSKYSLLPMGETNQDQLNLFHAPKNHLSLTVDADENYFYCLVSEYGNNHKLVRAHRGVETLDLKQADTLIEADEKSELEWINLLADHVLIGKRVDGVLQIHLYDKFQSDKNPHARDAMQGDAHSDLPCAAINNESVVDLSDHGLYNARAIVFPDGQYCASLTYDMYEDDTVRIAYDSPTTPHTDFSFDCKKNTLSIIQQDKFPNFSSADYRSEMRFARAQDGTAIPVSLFYHRQTPRNGEAPLKLSSYGAYGLHDDEVFSPMAIALADEGMVLATAHVRGGGIYGRQWYEAGKMDQKINTFTDTLDVARWLISENYTQSDKLALYGASAGGLPVGYALNNAPQLFCAVIADVPFVDVLTDMYDESLPLTQEEWLEWGNPRIKTQYDFMKAYSPLDNIKRGEYPAVMIIGGINDSQVPFRETAKLFAHLQYCKTDDRPLVFHINDKSGHHGDAGLYASLEESALKNAFVLWMTGSDTVSAPSSG